MPKKNANMPHYMNDPDPETIILPEDCSDNERKTATRYVVAGLNTRNEDGKEIIYGYVPWSLIKLSTDWPRMHDIRLDDIMDYDADKYQPVILALRDDILRPLDGVKRIMSAKKSNKPSLNAILVRIIRTKSAEEEAALSRSIANSIKPLSAISNYKLKLREGERYATLTNSTLKAHGIACITITGRRCGTTNGLKITGDSEVRLCKCAAQIDLTYGTGDGRLAKDYIEWFLAIITYTNWLGKTDISLSISFITAMSAIYEIASQRDDGQNFQLYTSRIKETLSHITQEEFKTYTERYVNQTKNSLFSHKHEKDIQQEVLTDIAGMASSGRIINEVYIRNFIK